MDRFVLVISFSQSDDEPTVDYKCLEPVNQIYDRLVDISAQETERDITEFPACSLSGSPSSRRWCFAVQAFQGVTQFCSSEWEELGKKHKNESEEDRPSAVEECLSFLRSQEGLNQSADQTIMTELIEEAAEGLHLLSDKLPPPGKALLDIVVLGSAVEPPPFKDLLPLLGALKHMSCWHAAKIRIVTQHITGWQKAVSSLSASVVQPADLDSCIDHKEIWRGGLLVREKKNVSEVRFDGFSLRSTVHQRSVCRLLQTPHTTTNLKLQSEVFHYFAPVLDLVQLINLSDLPSFLISRTQFELNLTEKSKKAKLLLDQLSSLRGKVGALFSLSCIVTPIAQPAASQLSSQRWRETLARRPKPFTVPDVEMKGETAVYFLLVQGSEDIQCGTGRVTMLHSDCQINGAAVMATVSALLKEKPLFLPGATVDNILHSLPCLHGDSLLKKERKVARVQRLVLKEYLARVAPPTAQANVTAASGRKEEASASILVPVNDLKAILSLARENYLQMADSSLPTADTCMTDIQASNNSGFQTISQQPFDWPERSVLHNIENLQRRRQRRRLGLLGPGSSDSLLGPKDAQKSSSGLLDAKELLKHFTSDGLPAGELQPLAITKGNVFQLSPDFSPRRVSQMPFSKVSASHYHGIDLTSLFITTQPIRSLCSTGHSMFCLDNQQSLDRDQIFARLQSRLIRYETQTTCSKEPCPLPFALSPAPSPAMMSEPGSVPDGETLQNSDVARLKRRSREMDIDRGYPHKRLVKSESSDSLCSQSSSSSGTHPALRSLRRQPSRSQSTSSISTSSSSSTRRTSGLATLPGADKSKPQPQQTHQRHSEDKSAKESRSQKHNRMLQGIVAETLRRSGVGTDDELFEPCCKRLFDLCKLYLKDLKTSHGLRAEMEKAANSNVKQLIKWVQEKVSEKGISS
ncbi:mdm2-binding protein isoform 2-T2 [Pholidichthys leucotaenia]